MPNRADRYEPQPRSPSSRRAPERPAVADVLVPRRVPGPFTYAVPAGLRARLVVGSLVLVPFGPATIAGVVVALDPPVQTPRPRPLREIHALLDRSPAEPALPGPLLALTRDVAMEYLAPWGQCLRVLLPRSAARPMLDRYRLTSQGRLALDRGIRLSTSAKTLLATLAAAPQPLDREALRHALPGSLARTLTAVTRRGLIEVLSEADAARIPPTTGGPGRRQPPSPATTSVGVAWWPALLAALAERRPAVFLLQGAAPDRWATLFDAAQAALSHGRHALVIAPEQAAAAAIAAQAAARWPDRVVLFHGGLSDALRAQTWWRIRDGAASLVIGTRSAVFAPLPRLGLIWVDDEDDLSLKEEQEPRYHAREVARLRTQREGAALIISSAHPLLETSQTLPASATAALPAAGPAARPAIHLVDLRRLPSGTLLSEPLLDGLRTALDAKTGAILFLNRKGFAPALLCRACGAAPRCRRCSVTLTFYRTAGRLACHYCGATLPVPDTCPDCLAPRLEPIGLGTERLEAELRRTFPDARIARLDRASVRTPTQAETIRHHLASGAVDILIGTRMLFQGPPLPRVGFVGLPHADSGLHLPDFRAAERLYHTLLDAVALARPAALGGRLVLQTYLPTQPAVAALLADDPSRFVEPELAARRALGYPPFTRLIALRVTGPDQAQAQEAARRWVAFLANQGPRRIEALGPVPAPVAVVRGRHRWHILVRSEDRDAVHQAVAATLEPMRRTVSRSVRLDVDVDPVEMG
ncbi:replication restart helicase PriA [Nitrospira sp. Kam-Ns4a]